MEYKKKYFFKIIIVGDVSVGKSSILTRFVDKKFENDYKSTIGVDFKFKDISLNELSNSPTIRFQIWDTAGQEKFRSMTHIYFKGSDLAIIVFDLTCIESKNSIFKNWIVSVKENIENPNIVILGNKSDINDPIYTNDIQEFCKDNNYKYFEVSAKEGSNIEKVFKEIGLFLFDLKYKAHEEVNHNKLEIVNNQNNDDCC